MTTTRRVVLELVSRCEIDMPIDMPAAEIERRFTHSNRPPDWPKPRIVSAEPPFPDHPEDQK